MVESLFTTQTPNLANQSDGTPSIATATTMRFAVAGTVSGIRFYTTLAPGTTETYTARLWECDVANPDGTGALLASATVQANTLTGGTWQNILFSSAVNVVTTRLYRVSIGSGTTGRYVATSGFWAAPDLVNGNVIGVGDGTNPIGSGIVHNGTFRSPDDAAYPINTFNATCYFVDVLFTAASQPITGVLAGSAPPASVALNATGSATGTLQGVAGVSGIVSDGLSSSASMLVGAARHAGFQAVGQAGDATQLPPPQAIYVRDGVAVYRRDPAGGYSRDGILSYRR